jgi:mono/diheme cytochrome c family protein
MQPMFCWAVWGPKSVDRYTTVQEIWTSWIDGEAVYDAAGIQTGKKPAIKLVEQYLQNKWRTPDDQKVLFFN